MSGLDRQARSVFDDAIRPQLLRELVAAWLPTDGKQQQQAQVSPGAVAALASAVHDHHLLHNDTGSGKGAVDAWQDVLKRFTAGESAEHRWALAAVTGVACYETSWQSFALLFATWLNNLIPLLKPTEPAFVRQAACKAAAQLLQRLASLQDMPGIRREGNAAVGKLVPALLQLLREDNKAGEVTHDAFLLLQAAIEAQPGAWKWHVSSLESLLVQELAGTTSRQMAILCGELLARLPQISGDSAAWSSFSRKTLVTCNALLDIAFAGLEDPLQSEYAMSTLNPPGVEPAAPWIEPPQVSSSDFEQHFLLHFTAFVSSLRQLLASPYPNAVPVGVGPTLALAARALTVDGTRPSTAHTAPTPTQRLVAVSSLPKLQLLSMQLLQALLLASRRQMVAYAAQLARVLDHSLRLGSSPQTCKSVSCMSVRSQLYDVCTDCFYMLGAGFSTLLSPSLASYAIEDLNILCDMKQSTTPAVIQQTGKKRKKGKSGNPHYDQKAAIENAEVLAEFAQDGVLGVVTSTTDAGAASLAALQLRTSALNALAAMLAVGGTLIPQRARTDIDKAVYESARLASRDVNSSTGTRSPQRTSLQVAHCIAAHKALLASVLSPRPHRAQHLPQALVLFRQGRSSGVPGMQEVCTNALLACEALLHPHSPALAPLHVDVAAPTYGRSDPWKDVDLSFRPRAERIQEASPSTSHGSEHQAINTLAVDPHVESRPSSPAQQFQHLSAAAEPSHDQQDATASAAHAHAPDVEDGHVPRQAVETQQPLVDSTATAASSQALPEPALLSKQQLSPSETLLQPARPAAAAYIDPDEDSEGPMPSINMAPPDDEDDGDEMTS